MALKIVRLGNPAPVSGEGAPVDDPSPVRSVDSATPSLTGPLADGAGPKLLMHLFSEARTGRLVVAEEGTMPWGFGAELVARVSEALAANPPRCARVGAHHLPIPCARPAEEAVLPDIDRVVEAVRRVM